MLQEKVPQPNTFEFPLNQRLLEEALKLKEERRILKERLSKIESSRGEVSQTVFNKVHTDYSTRLQNVSDQLLQKKQDIDRELASLYETRDKIQNNLKGHKEELEEIQFRHKLGEYTKEEFHQKAKGEEDKITRFEQVLTSVQTNIGRYESLFQGDEELFGVEEPSHPLQIEEGELEVDEWEEEAEEAQSASNADEPSTATPTDTEGEWMEATKANLQIVAPQITIIAGNENVGKTFQIRNTLSMGRSHTNQVVLKDAKSSRQHAEIRAQGNECILIDLNSSNGTLVNGQRVHEHLLTPNDEIQIGDFVMQFQQ
ncbi:MAG: FHA domain-containing protein [Deltaproteobacteria bacterium]|nr:FHA domain-containing protein [Deltaproteobacteria bacterium]